MIDIHIGAHYPTRWSRREPWGLFWPVDLSSDRPIRRVELSMEGDGSGPFAMQFPGEEKDGRGFKGVAWKPDRNGEFWPLTKAFYTLEPSDPVFMRRGPHRILINQDPVIVPANPFTPALSPIRAIFYYSWFTGVDGWGEIGTVFHPTRGRYDLLNTEVVDAHIRDMEYGKCDVAIATWWGQEHKTDRMMPTLLRRSEGRLLKWCVYHEMEGHTDPSSEQIRRDLAYIRERYASHPNYLRINGRFVVFVYNSDDGRDCSVTTRWKRANDKDDAHLVLKVVGSVHHGDCPDQPNGGWHQYDPTHPVQTTWDATGRVESYNISPGFWNGLEPAPRLERDIRRWRRNVREMVASQARWQLITSYNEHGEGTAVESCAEWASDSGYGAYLDALHTNGQ